MQLFEFVKATGATHRQIDLWYRYGMDLCEPSKEGHGNYRIYKPEAVAPVKLIVTVSNTFPHGIPTWIMKKLFEHYDEGYLDMDGFYFLWRVDRGVRADASPTGGGGPIS